MTPIVLLLTGFALLASLAVLAQSFRRAVLAWRELQHALAACPERVTARITHIEFNAALPAGRQVRFAGALRRPRPALRAAA
jgi:hypothetical protein